MQLPFDYREQEPAIEGVEAVWTYRVSRDVEAHVSHIVLPDGCVDLIYRASVNEDGVLGDAALFISGASRTPRRVSIGPGACYMGLRFRPGWGGVCLGIDPKRTGHLVIDASVVDERLAGLRRDIMAVRSRSEVAARLKSFGTMLSNTARPDRRALAAVRLLRVSGGRMDSREVAALTSVSPRTLRREVTAAVGLPPKGLARVFRFRRAIRLRKRDGSLGLAALAQEAGYADQAHMTRDFQELGGFAPSRFPPLLVA